MSRQDRAQRGLTLLANSNDDNANRTRAILNHVLIESNSDQYISHDFFNAFSKLRVIFLVTTSLMLVSPNGLAQGQPPGQPCVDNGPCITDIRELNQEDGPSLVVTWDGRGTWDHFNVKYYRPGRESPLYREEGDINRVTLPGVHPDTTYTFQVQACGINLQELARGLPLVECGGWAEASFHTAISLEGDVVLAPAES